MTAHTLYELWLMITQNNFPDSLSEEEKSKLQEFTQDVSKVKRYQHKETIHRYKQINDILKTTYQVDHTKAKI